MTDIEKKEYANKKFEQYYPNINKLNNISTFLIEYANPKKNKILNRLIIKFCEEIENKFIIKIYNENYKDFLRINDDIFINHYITDIIRYAEEQNLNIVIPYILENSTSNFDLIIFELTCLLVYDNTDIFEIEIELQEEDISSTITNVANLAKDLLSEPVKYGFLSWKVRYDAAFCSDIKRNNMLKLLYEIIKKKNEENDWEFLENKKYKEYLADISLFIFLCMDENHVEQLKIIISSRNIIKKEKISFNNDYNKLMEIIRGILEEFKTNPITKRRKVRISQIITNTQKSNIY